MKLHTNVLIKLLQICTKYEIYESYLFTALQSARLFSPKSKPEHILKNKQKHKISRRSCDRLKPAPEFDPNKRIKSGNYAFDYWPDWYGAVLAHIRSRFWKGQ